MMERKVWKCERLKKITPNRDGIRGWSAKGEGEKLLGKDDFSFLYHPFLLLLVGKSSGNEGCHDVPTF